jgi:hypothetical protein
MAVLVFWVVTRCGLVGRYYFGGTYCTIFENEDADLVFLLNVGICQQVHMAL